MIQAVLAWEKRASRRKGLRVSDGRVKNIAQLRRGVQASPGALGAVERQAYPKEQQRAWKEHLKVRSGERMRAIPEDKQTSELGRSLYKAVLAWEKACVSAHGGLGG